MELKFENYLCGVSLDDASQCNNNDTYPSSSGSSSSSDFSLGYLFYEFKVWKDQFLWCFIR